jgi:hypothetical protein
MISPSAAPEQWDYLVVAGTRAPGVVRLSGAGLKIGWDVQSPQGMAGGITRRIGEPVKEFDAEFELSDEVDAFGKSDFDAWEDFQKLLEASAPQGIGKKPHPLDIAHPDLARVHITSATIGQIGLVQLDGKGGGKVVIHFLEYRPPKALAPIALTKTEGDKKIDAASAEVKALQTEWQKL